MPMQINNSKGSSLVESIVVMPILIILAVGLSVSLLWGWARLEISSLTQELLVCERSETRISECRRQFQNKIAFLPGQWKLLRIQKQSAGVSLDLQSNLQGVRRVFKISEPDPWLQAKIK